MKFQPCKSRVALIEPLESRRLLSAATPTMVHLGSATASHTETASASIVATQLTSTTYQYAVTLTDTATAPATKSDQVGTFWYAWVPGWDYLDTAPLSVSSPAGWTDQIVHAGPNDGYSIQWVASSNAIQAGKSLSGFVFTSTDTPAQIFGKSNFYPSGKYQHRVRLCGCSRDRRGFPSDSDYFRDPCCAGQSGRASHHTAPIHPGRQTDSLRQYRGYEADQHHVSVFNHVEEHQPRQGHVRQPDRNFLVCVGSRQRFPRHRSADGQHRRDGPTRSPMKAVQMDLPSNG